MNACMVRILLDERVKVEDHVLISLKKDNMYDHDFLAEVEEEFKE